MGSMTDAAKVAALTPEEEAELRAAYDRSLVEGGNPSEEVRDVWRLLATLDAARATAPVAGREGLLLVTHYDIETADPDLEVRVHEDDAEKLAEFLRADGSDVYVDQTKEARFAAYRAALSSGASEPER